MRKRSQRVVPFYDAAQFESSEEVDFHVWFSPIFLRGIHGCEEYRLSVPARMLSPVINPEFVMECKLTAHPIW